MATFRNSKTGGNWNATTAWLETVAGVTKAATKTPTGEDKVKIVGEETIEGLTTGGSITVTEGAICEELESSAGFAKTFTINAGVLLGAQKNWSWGGGGTFTMAPTAELGVGTNTNKATGKFTPGGATYSGVVNVGSQEATIELLGELKGKTLVFTEGTLLTKGFTVELSSQFKCEPAAAKSATITLEGSKVILTTTSGVAVWSLVATGTLTLNAGTSTIEVTGTGELEKKFLGAGLTYNNLTIKADNVVIKGSNTFNVLKLETAGKTKGTKFEKETTQTISALEVNGSAGSKVKMLSLTATKEWKLHKVSGNVNVDFIEVSDCHVDASPKWFGGPTTDSTYGTGNLNWLEEKENPGFMSNAGVTTTKVVKFKASSAFTVPGPLQGSMKTQFSAKASETSAAALKANTAVAFPDHIAAPTVNAALAGAVLTKFLSVAPLHASARIAASAEMLFTTKAPLGAVAPLEAVASLLRFTTKAPLTASGKLVVGSVVLFPVKGKLNESGTGKLDATTKIQFATVAVLSGVSHLSSNTAVRLKASVQATSRLGAVGSSLVQFHAAAPLTSAARIAGISDIAFPSRISGYIASVLLGGHSLVRFEEVAQPSAVALLEGDAAASFTASARFTVPAHLRASTRILFPVNAASTAIGEPGTVLLFDAPVGRVELYDAL